MSLYQNFIGIDIGKFTFVVASHGDKKTQEYANDAKGIALFMKGFKATLPTALVVLETTGGHEMRLLFTLCDKGICVHRANTRKVKYFIRSFGNAAKTDALDAKALALYGAERQASLERFKPPAKQQLMLYECVQRRRELTQWLVAEKNRQQAPRASGLIKASCEAMKEAIKAQLEEITEAIKGLVEKDGALQARVERLKTVPGIGEITAQNLVALMPELGSMGRRQVASLAGVAPRANDSGKQRGYRRTGHGRDAIKPVLFVAAMAARNSKTELKAYYEKLVARGKKKMVALTALMRKLIVMANARLKELAVTMELKTSS